MVIVFSWIGKYDYLCEYPVVFHSSGMMVYVQILRDEAHLPPKAERFFLMRNLNKSTILIRKETGKNDLNEIGRSRI